MRKEGLSKIVLRLQVKGNHLALRRIMPNGSLEALGYQHFVLILPTLIVKALQLTQRAQRIE